MHDLGVGFLMDLMSVGSRAAHSFETTDQEYCARRGSRQSLIELANDALDQFAAGGCKTMQLWSIAGGRSRKYDYQSYRISSDLNIPNSERSKPLYFLTIVDVIYCRL
jgi:hypothetical protein